MDSPSGWATLRAMDSAQATMGFPSPEGLNRLASAIGNGCRVIAGPPISGGVAAKTHRLTLYGRDGTERSLVLKRYPVGNDTPELEWERLGCASRVSLPTPDRVAVDPSGLWFGEPALAMTTLQGRVDMFPSDKSDWTRQLAVALATIHQTDLGSDIPAVVRRPHLASRWRLWNSFASSSGRAAIRAARI